MHQVSHKPVRLSGEPGVLSVVNRIPGQRFQKILDGIQDGLLDIVWPDGERTRHGSGVNSITLTLRSYEPIRSLIVFGQIGFAESFLKGEWGTSDLRGLFDLIMRNEHRFSDRIAGGYLARLKFSLAHRFNRNTVAGSRKNIAYHYDLGNDFYSLWLDSSMSYSSALYRQKGDSLEQAQQQKINRVIKLLALDSDSKVLEIGCGWGSLAKAIAVNTGSQVRAISLSRAQLEYARKDNRTQSVDFQYADYRRIRGSYDHVVSIEMFEAVGIAYWETYFRQLSQLLRVGGSALLQIITIDEDRFASYQRNPDFIQRYIFPGGMLPTGSIIKKLIQKHGFELTHTDWMGDSYAATVAAWRSNFEKHLPQVRELGYDERFIRMWRYYLAYCETGFVIDRTNVGMFLITRR